MDKLNYLNKPSVELKKNFALGSYEVASFFYQLDRHTGSVIKWASLYIKVRSWHRAQRKWSRINSEQKYK
jgi:hypothetical protein